MTEEARDDTLHRVVRTLTALIVLPALLLVGAVPSTRALYRCMYDGTARSECCCPRTASDEPAPVSRLGQRCCCDEETLVTSVCPSVEVHPRLDALPPVTAIASGPRLFLAACPSRGSSRTARPPGLGPPLILTKHSLLL